MADNEAAKARNMIRWLMRKMVNELDIRYGSDSHFFMDVVKRGIDCGVIEKDYRGRYSFTPSEQVPGYQKGARHRGKHSREKLTLL